MKPNIWIFMTFCYEKVAWTVDHMKHHNRVLRAERNERFATASEGTCDVISQSL